MKAKNFRRWAGAAVAAVVLGLGVAGCGGDEAGYTQNDNGIISQQFDDYGGEPDDANYTQPKAQENCGAGTFDPATHFCDERDGQIYRFVTIGEQVWMAENLNYDTADGTGSWCYGDSADNCAKYGRLYNWNTAMSIDISYQSTFWPGSDVKHQGVCPDGWYLPSDADWTALTTTVGGAAIVAGTKLKSASYWERYLGVPIGTNDYGFSALPGGVFHIGRGFDSEGRVGRWWSATEYDAVRAKFRGMGYLNEYVYDSWDSKSASFSVRCIKDAGPSSIKDRPRVLPRP